MSNPTFRLDTAAVIADLDELATQSGGRFAGAKRLAWSPDWLAARDWLRGKLDQIGLPVTQDLAGNIWATVQGDTDAFLIVGSHIDAVPDGGWLDGVLGLMAALETVRQLAGADLRPPVTVKFVDWADEEGARFGRDGGDRIADEAHAVGCEHRPVEQRAAEVVFADVLPGQHRVDAGERSGGARVDARDARVRDWAAHERRPQHPRPREVRRILRASGDLLASFDADLVAREGRRSGRAVLEGRRHGNGLLRRGPRLPPPCARVRAPGGRKTSASISRTAS